MEYCFYWSWRGLTPSEWAAWVQAVGSVVAIGVAIWIPMRQQRIDAKERARDRKARQKGMALAVLNDLASIEREIRQYFDQYYDPVENHFESAEFEKITMVPASLQVLAPNLHELGDASDKVNQVVASLILANDQLGEWTHRRYGTGDLGDIDKAIYSNLRQAKDLAKVAIAELLNLFDLRN